MKEKQQPAKKDAAPIPPAKTQSEPGPGAVIAKTPSDKKESGPSDVANRGLLPSRYELCQIAAAMFGPEAAKKPVKAVRAALGLWLSAEWELSEASNREVDGNVVAYGMEGWGDGESLEEVILVAELEKARAMGGTPICELVEFGSSEGNSDAFRWVNSNARDPRDQFKTFKKFANAWEKAFGEQAYEFEFRTGCSVKVLEVFLMRRTAERRAKDAKRQKRNRRAERKEHEGGETTGEMPCQKG